jgi:hypothetical protein
MEKEAAIILFSFIFGYAFDNLWAKVTYKIPSKVRKNDYAKFIFGEIRIHHNFLGYILIVFGFFIYPLFLVPIGLGIIIGHRLRDRLFWFVENIGKDVNEINRSIKNIQKKAKKDIGEVRKNIAKRSKF